MSWPMVNEFTSNLQNSTCFYKSPQIVLGDISILKNLSSVYIYQVINNISFKISIHNLNEYQITKLVILQISNGIFFKFQRASQS